MHSFVDTGILPQLLVYVLSFVGLRTSCCCVPSPGNADFGVTAVLLLVALKGYVVEAIGGFLVMLVATSIRSYRTDFERTEEEESWPTEFGCSWDPCLSGQRSAHHLANQLPVFNQFLEPLSPLLQPWRVLEQPNPSRFNKHNSHLAPTSTKRITWFKSLSLCSSCGMGVGNGLSTTTNMATVVKNLALSLTSGGLADC